MGGVFEGIGGLLGGGGKYDQPNLGSLNAMVPQMMKAWEQQSERQWQLQQQALQYYQQDRERLAGLQERALAPYESQMELRDPIMQQVYGQYGGMGGGGAIPEPASLVGPENPYDRFIPEIGAAAPVPTSAAPSGMGGGGGFDVTGSPLWQAARRNIAQQYDQARGQIMGQLPAGGGLQAALAENEMARAGAGVQALGDIGETERARWFALGTGQTPQFPYLGSAGYAPIQQPYSTGGLGTAAQTQLGAIQTQMGWQQNQLGKKGDVGLGLGTLLGGLL